MTATRTRIAAGIAVAALLLTAACSDDGDDTATTGGDGTETTASAAGDDATTAPADDPYGESTTTAADEGAGGGEAATGAEVALGDGGDLGQVLVDAQGLTLYAFTNDTPGEPSTCEGGCSATWPALAGPVTAGDGVDGALLGTVTNADGSEQATYDGRPLYYFSSDAGPGDTNGQAVGDVWFVVDATGATVEG